MYSRMLCQCRAEILKWNYYSSEQQQQAQTALYFGKNTRLGGGSTAVLIRNDRWALPFFPELKNS